MPADQQPLFQALVGAGSDQTRYPEIAEAGRRSIQAFTCPAATRLPGDAAAALALADGRARLAIPGGLAAPGKPPPPGEPPGPDEP